MVGKGLGMKNINRMKFGKIEAKKNKKPKIPTTDTIVLSPGFELGT